jgi:hypothetical protein
MVTDGFLRIQCDRDFFQDNFADHDAQSPHRRLQSVPQTVHRLPLAGADSRAVESTVSECTQQLHAHH